MPNENKIKIVKEIEQKMKHSSAFYFTRYTGINVKKITELRKNFKENSVEYKISKNTLSKLAASNLGYDKAVIDTVFTGQIGIAYSEADPTAPAKVIKKFKKENKDCLEVVGLIFEGEFFESEKYKDLANLPSKEELFAKLLGDLQSPMTKIVSMLSSQMVKMVTVLDSLKNQKNTNT
jgi:large subunit ribosomal protein L10